MKCINQRHNICKSRNAAFTIVELLVVVVIIAILSAITLVAYSGISQQATLSLIKSDLSNASTAIKAFQVENGSFPLTISTDCNAKPDSSTNKCLKISGSNNYVGYSANNTASPKTFLLIASNGSNVYKVTDGASPTQLAATMQPNVTPGAISELHAGKANSGTSQGINSPLTTTWADTSGSSNNGTLLGYSGSPWVGSGTAGDPWGLIHNTDGQSVRFAGPSDLYTFSTEMWLVRTGTGTNNNYLYIFESFGAGRGFNIYLANNNTVNVQWNCATPSVTHNYYTLGTTALNTPAHAVLTYDGTTLTTYFNGIAGTPTTVCHTPWTGNVTSTTYTAGAPWKQVTTRTYPFALTSTQVTANYNAGVVW